MDKHSHTNPGNFIALLHFKMQSGDKVADHLASCGSTPARLHRMSSLGFVVVSFSPQ